jgi:SAM-dependent methyltransferase
MSISTEILSSLACVEPVSLLAAEQQQRDHYDRIVDAYEAHYGDAPSREYRRRFIYQEMFDGMELHDMNVLDAMCGSGHTTEYLSARGAQVTGLDISPQEIKRFQDRSPGTAVVCRSLLDSKLDSDSFDCVAVVGGLHHLHPHLNAALAEIHRILKPGGYFCFMEPHSGSIPDLVRRFWYQVDPLFSDNEAAIDFASLQSAFKNKFIFNRITYRGNLAFLFVLNSLIFRMPAPIKSAYSPILMALEGIINKLQNKLTACFAVGQWQKKIE